METGELDPRGNRHPDNVKEVAYQLWAFVCSRRPGKVSELLQSGQYGEPVSVTDRTILSWSKDQAWSQRVQDDLRAIAPDLREQTITELIFGGLAGARYMRAVNEGWEAEPNRERLSSSIAAVDRVGKADHASTLAVQSAPSAAEVSVAGKSVAELMQIEAESRRKRKA
jgi:hypothetical protein